MFVYFYYKGVFTERERMRVREIASDGQFPAAMAGVKLI